MGDNGKRATYTVVMRTRVDPNMLSDIDTIADRFDVKPAVIVRSALHEYIKYYDHNRNLKARIDVMRKRLV